MKRIEGDSQVIAISGIDTGIGKTVVTGLLGGYLLGKGKRVITQKLVQTGCSGLAEDILTHRRLMGQELQPEDYQGLTCPYVFARPCSPHLAAALAGRTIDPEVIRQATRALASRYEMILLEGAGGLLVPLTNDLTFLDFLEQEGTPLILVSSPRLGSINHTLSALELARNRGISVLGIVYNRYHEGDPVIASDSGLLFSQYLRHYGYRDCVVDLFAVEEYSQRKRKLDFGAIFGE
jgi:dethiobiotin synthetase